MSNQFRSEYVPQEDGTYELTVVVGPPPHSVVLVEIEIWTRRMTSGVLLSSTQRLERATHMRRKTSSYHTRRNRICGRYMVEPMTRSCYPRERRYAGSAFPLSCSDFPTNSFSDESWSTRWAQVHEYQVSLLTSSSIESILSQDPHIRSGVMFGRGRFHNGVVIDPVAEFAFDPRDEDRLRRYRDLIWYVVETA